jgi:GntR family transcriptional regulator / MocR family aminotransferase
MTTVHPGPSARKTQPGKTQPGRMTACADLPIVVDRCAGASMATQIAGQVRDAVTSGMLVARERLPSTRDLAVTLGVSRTVITTAYAQLFAEGWLEGRHGAGTFVADVAPSVPSVLKRAVDATPAHSGTRSGTSQGADEPWPVAQGVELLELRPGIPWAAGIEPAIWRRAWRQAATQPPASWPDPHGIPELRGELARYLRRSRVLNVPPDHILITRGVSNGLAAIAAALVKPGDKVGVEEPGYPSAREVLRRAGADIAACRVDEHGIVPDELPGGLRLLYTTPAHQYPLGGRLPVPRRQALITWARATGTLIVEDDYDGEFRYDVAPLPSLYSMAPDVVVYLGTTSKTLTPVLGAGWLVASPDLVSLLAERRREISERVSEPVQRALLTLLVTGDLEKHVRRMRLEYARRRAVLVAALAGLGGGAFRLLGDTAGMHVVLELPYPAERAMAAAAERGVALYCADRYYAGPSTLDALVLGYGAIPLGKLRRAATILRASLPAA